MTSFTHPQFSATEIPSHFTIQNFHPNFLPLSLFSTRYPLHSSTYTTHLSTPTYIPIYQPTYLPTCMPACLSMSLPTYLSTYLATSIATLNRYPIPTHFKQSERQKVRALSNPPLTFKCPYFLRKISVYVRTVPPQIKLKNTYVYTYTYTSLPIHYSILLN
jgi:hypothetical protein